MFHPPSVLRMDASNLDEEWELFEQKFDLFLIASGANEKSSPTQLAIFLHCIGEDALKVYNSFVFESSTGRNSLTEVRSKFKSYCASRKNVVFERFTFFQLTQTAGESIDAFVTTLRLRAKSCQFGDQEESLIRDRVVLGCADIRVQERLLRESDLSLQKAIDICRAAEASRDQMKVLQASTTTSASSTSSS